MKTILLQTSNNWGSTALRATLGIVVLAHGLQLTLGWFGGNGLTATLAYFTEAIQLPWIIAFSVIALQVLSPVLLLLGLATRLAALSLFGLFIGMILMVHLEHGFFMNWSGTAQSEGFEYHILVLGMCAALMFTGGGAWSIDRKLTHSLTRPFVS